MNKKSVFCLLILFVAIPVELFAQLQANFRADQINYHGTHSNCDFAVGVLPTCELYFRMGIYVNNARQGNLLTYPGGCNYHELSDGAWYFPNQTVTTNIPDLSTGAQLFFALFDEDPLDADDLLGTHFSFFNSPGSNIETNNNNRVISNTACGDQAFDNDSIQHRFTLNYGVWFEDLSAPDAPEQAPYHTDGDVGAGYDNDHSLDFSWSAASDPNSGISGYQYELRKNGISSISATLSGLSLNIGSAEEGASYELRIRAQNGDVLPISNPQWSAWTAWSKPVLVDTVPDSITSLVAFTQAGGEQIEQGEAQGDKTPYLEWTVSDSSSPIEGFSTSLDTPPDCVIDTVAYSSAPGPLPQGTNTFYVRPIDAAGNCGEPASFEIVVFLPGPVFSDSFEAPAGYCTTDEECGLGEHCFDNTCNIDGRKGDACQSSNQCETGLDCVDGVCCSSSCTGTCEACDLDGFAGECLAVPAGEDPENECGGFSCANYYWGWDGDACYRAADASGGLVACNGSRSCEVPSASCLLTGQGPLVLSCEGASVPDPATCTGTNPPSCKDAPGIISGFVWIDANGNGRIEGGEQGAPGVSVSYFEDADSDGLPDGPSLGSIESDEAGIFEIEIPAGSYVLEAAGPGLCQTTGDDSAIDDLSGFTYTIVVVSGGTGPTVNIGIQYGCS